MLVADRFDWWRFADDHRSPLRSGGLMEWVVVCRK